MLAGVQNQNQIYCKYILDLFHAHLFSFETSVVDCILIIICVCVRGGKSTKIFYSSKSTITLLKLYLSTSKSTSLKIYSSKSKK